MRVLAAAILTCIATVSCFAQDADAPKTLAGFLKPGTHIGVRVVDGTAGIQVTIYSKSDLEIALDARRMDLDVLAAKYEKVAQARDRALEQFTASLESRRGDLAAGKEFGEPKASLLVDRHEAFYTILHAGDDYILLSNAGDQAERRAIAIRFISTIGWYNDDLRFHTSVPHVTKSEDRTR